MMMMMMMMTLLLFIKDRGTVFVKLSFMGSKNSPAACV